MRPIDADALIAKCRETKLEIPVFPALLQQGRMFKEAVDNAPTLDYAPVRHGEWIHLGFLTCKCSLCETTFHDLPAENYCPNCGAKMDGGKEND